MTTSRLHHLLHNQLLAQAETHVAGLLGEWGFPTYTRVGVTLVCAETTETDYYGKAHWAYLPNQEFRITLRCDIADQLDWLIRHELLEILLAQYGDFCLTLIDAVAADAPGWRKTLVDQHATVRDTLIEWLLHLLAPEMAPPLTARLPL